MPQLPIELQACPETTFARGQQLFGPGDVCRNFVYLINGSVRVDLNTESGHTIVLYRITAGSTCIMTTSCLLSQNNYAARAVVEEDTTARLMGEHDFRRCLAESPEFQRFVFSSFSDRLSALMSKVEEVAFGSIDCRLARSLLQRADGASHIALTHDQLAADIGTAREVISRKLSQWEALGLVTRQRGSVALLQVDKLNAIAERQS